MTVLSADQPLVSVVVVYFNRAPLTRKCLQHLLAQDYPRMELVVVDNGSEAQVGNAIREEFPNLRHVRVETNTGFAGGHNRGIEAANGRYVAIINNDALASPGWLRAMVEVAEADPGLGSVASILIDGNDPEVLDSFGVGIAMDGMSRQAHRGVRVFEPEVPTDVLLPSGAACLFRKDALDVVGLFDEAFFAYCEDTDLGLRLRWAGYRCAVAPGSTAIHYRSLTSGKFSLQKVFWVERNHYWVAVKNFPLPLLLLLPLATLWRYVIQAYLTLARRGETGAFVETQGFGRFVRPILRATMHAAAGVPAMLRQRKAILRARKVSTLEMLRTLWGSRMSMWEVIHGSSHAG